MKAKALISLLAVAVLFQACALSRAFTYWSPNITDHKIFHHTEMVPGDSAFHFAKGNEEVFGEQRRMLIIPKGTTDTIKMTYGDYLAQQTTTTAFLVIRNDSILFEQYFKGYTRDSISKNFSITKSITSLLTGIAIDEGYIESVHDPVTKYVPELKKKDPKFERLTIEHLLNMRAGFKFNEDNYFPFSRATRLYYGTNHLGKVKRAKFKHEPGEVLEYQSLVSALLGVVVERATGRNLSEYLQEKVWIPLGMENRATWDIDDKRHHSNHAHVGVNATAIDLAKIGRLYLNNGSWNGKQIVSADWVAKSRTPIPVGYNRSYQYQWYSFGTLVQNPDGEHNKWQNVKPFADSLSARKFAEENYRGKGFDVLPMALSKKKNRIGWALLVYQENCEFAAEGILNQWIYVDPKKNIIVVRLGEKLDTPPSFIQSLIRRL